MIKMILVFGLVMGIMIAGSGIDYWDIINKYEPPDNEPIPFYNLIMRGVFLMGGKVADVGVSIGEIFYPHNAEVMIGLLVMIYLLPSVAFGFVVLYFCIKERRSFLRRDTYKGKDVEDEWEE